MLPIRTHPPTCSHKRILQASGGDAADLDRGADVQWLRRSITKGLFLAAVATPAATTPAVAISYLAAVFPPNAASQDTATSATNCTATSATSNPNPK